ncbi:MAG: arginine--tRNA ligase [Chloroflexaceae bacterium]|nr:arginine--tRNA ligase [Chloroflexaceae bacterium]
MHYTLDRFTSDIERAILATGRVPEELLELQQPKANIPADLAFPAFRAAKTLGIAPPQLAQELAATVRFDPETLVGEVATSGAYLNFTLHAQRFAASVLYEILTLGATYGHTNQGQGRTVVIDYSSPNIAKRMHVGHIRSTIIGHALVQLYRALGYHTIGDNHLGDWGKQFGVILAAIDRYGKPMAEGEAMLAELETIYSRYSTAMKDEPEMDAAARAWSLRLEQGDPHARELWQWCVGTTLAANQRNYDRLGVQFDHMYGESFYEEMLDRAIAETIEHGAARRDEDRSVVVELEGLPLFLLQRNDGGTLYITRDVTTIQFRLHEFDPERIIYVVGSEQELHFRQLFALMRAMGYAQNVELVHIPFGRIFDAQGQPISTRRGNMIYLEDMLNEATRRARAVLDSKQSDLSAAEQDQVAELVGVGAVIYNDLYQDTRRNITIDWDRMLATEGNSATYLQYSYARCRSILRRAAADGDLSVEQLPPPNSELAALLTEPAEQLLLRHLARMPQAVREAGNRYAPFVLADWCYTTAREFGVFFEQCPVLKAATPDLRAARLLLVAATAQALHNGLALLGIQAPERM